MRLSLTRVARELAARDPLDPTKAAPLPKHTLPVLGRLLGALPEGDAFYTHYGTVDVHDAPAPAATPPAGTYAAAPPGQRHADRALLAANVDHFAREGGLDALVYRLGLDGQNAPRASMDELGALSAAARAALPLLAAPFCSGYLAGLAEACFTRFSSLSCDELRAVLREEADGRATDSVDALLADLEHALPVRAPAYDLQKALELFEVRRAKNMLSCPLLGVRIRGADVLCGTVEAVDRAAVGARAYGASAGQPARNGVSGRSRHHHRHHYAAAAASPLRPHLTVARLADWAVSERVVELLLGDSAETRNYAGLVPGTVRSRSVVVAPPHPRRRAPGPTPPPHTPFLSPAHRAPQAR